MKYNIKTGADFDDLQSVKILIKATNFSSINTSLLKNYVDEMRKLASDWDKAILIDDKCIRDKTKIAIKKKIARVISGFIDSQMSFVSGMNTLIGEIDK